MRSGRRATLSAAVLAAALSFTGPAVDAQHEEPPLGEVVASVDEALHAAWDTAGVEPAHPADSLTRIRRLSLSLTGAVPSLEEIRRAMSYPESERVDRYLDEVLSDRRFADYWAERLARAFVGTDEGPFIVFRRRRFVDWLSDQLHEGRAYDAIVRELIAAEGLWTDRPAVNFVTAHRRDPEMLAARTARAFLGVRMDCAQCHDHPFATWKQTDFRGLAAFYADIDQNPQGIRDGDAPFRIEEPGRDPIAIEPAVPFAEEAFEPADRRRTALARWVTAPDNARFGRAIAHRTWVMLLGRGLTSEVDAIDERPVVEGILAPLADDFVEHGHDLRRLIRVIAHTDAFARGAAAKDGTGAEQQQALFAAFPSVPLRAEQIAGSLAQVSQLKTIDHESHILWRLMREGSEKDFVARYGDAGPDELHATDGTMMQRLTLMNGKVVRERTKAGLFNAAGRIGLLAPDDEARLEAVFLVALTRPPSDAERARFVPRLAGVKGKERDHIMSDLLWTLVNTTEFSWTH